MAIVLRRLRMIIAPPLFLFTALLVWSSSYLLQTENRLECIRSISLNLLPTRRQSIMAIEHQQNLTQMSPEEMAMQDAQEQMKLLRSVLPIEERDIQSPKNASWASISPSKSNSSCEGRRVFIHELPPKFNDDLVRQCDGLLPWMNMCSYMSNSGMGDELSEDEILSPQGCWFKTHQYALEIIFHARIREYSCRVYDPSTADVFYVPYYGGLDVMRLNFVENATNTQRDALGRELLEYLVRQPSWSRSRGRDHLLVLGKISWDFRRNHNNPNWGSDLLRRPEMQRVTKLLIERHPWHPNDVGVPHPTLFHPRSDADVKQWQAKVLGATRTSLVSFAGAPRPGQSTMASIRGELIRQCMETRGNECRVLDCAHGACSGSSSTIGLFMSSDFCLQPPGDSPTRRSVFDSLLAGCIPVFFDPFTAYMQYPWHLPADSDSYSVFIPGESVQNGGSVNVVDVLRAMSAARRERMRRYIVHQVLPSIVYAQPGARLVAFDDAFDIALRNVIRRVASKAEYEGAPVSEEEPSPTRSHDDQSLRHDSDLIRA